MWSGVINAMVLYFIIFCVAEAVIGCPGDFVVALVAVALLVEVYEFFEGEGVYIG